MRITACACLAFALLAPSSLAFAQSPSPPTESSWRNSMDILALIEAVSRQTSKNFVVDPRVRGEVYLANDPSRVSYGQFLAILKVHGYIAVESGGLVYVVPDANARLMAVPLISGNEKVPDAQYVTKIIKVKSMPAGMLVPILRPLLPQQGHLAASVCSNDLIMVDAYDNVKRIESVVQALDKGEPYKVERCKMPESAPAPQRLNRIAIRKTSNREAVEKRSPTWRAAHTWGESGSFY